jgi:GT2 family glycosyltransferase
MPPSDQVPPPPAGSGPTGVPDLSIVIVNWNTLQMTRECLQSVFDGLARPAAMGITAQVILVDNASADGSADMVAADFPQVDLIRNATNRGFAAANNQGFAIARGRHILLLNSDTLVHGTALQDSVAWLDAHPKVGALGIKALNADGTTQMTCHQFPSLMNQFLLASGLWKLKRPRFFGRYMMTDWARDTEREVEVISGCWLMLRRPVLEGVGPLDEDFFFFGEETDWCRRMRDAGWVLMFSPLGTFTHYGSVSARKLNHKRDVMLAGSKVRLHRKHGGEGAAAVAWVMAAGFNASRAVFWSLYAALGGGARARERAQHFRRVTGELGLIWRGGSA